MKVQTTLTPEQSAAATNYDGETKLMRRLRLVAQQRWACRLFRNNVGQAYAGKAFRGVMGLIIRNYYVVRYGLAVGSSDIVGLAVVTITQEMVGRKIAVFTAVEVKSATGKLTTRQGTFIDMVKSLGGIAGAVRSVEDLEQLMKGVDSNEHA